MNTLWASLRSESFGNTGHVSRTRHGRHKYPPHRITFRPSLSNIYYHNFVRQKNPRLSLETSLFHLHIQLITYESSQPQTIRDIEYLSIPITSPLLHQPHHVLLLSLPRTIIKIYESLKKSITVCQIKQKTATKLLRRIEDVYDEEDNNDSPEMKKYVHDYWEQEKKFHERELEQLKEEDKKVCWGIGRTLSTGWWGRE